MEMRGMSGELLGTIGSIGFSDTGEASIPVSTQPPVTSSPWDLQREAKYPLQSSLSLAFTAKKRKILEALHPPDRDYSDKSPKGSVDAQIVDLIDEINGYEGLVTTSSCAGRVSVFLEGEKKSSTQHDRDGVSDEDVSNEEVKHASHPGRKEVPGGKGLGGRWLFVSHEPLGETAGRDLMAMFGMASCDCPVTRFDPIPRLIKFAFEPLILHVLCASLKHARPLLAAAIDAGFRESGVQTLKILDDEEGEGTGVMVGIRTAGLGLESVVGMYSSCGELGDHCHAIVSVEYLGLLVRISEERFEANDERRERFRRELRSHMERFQEQDKEANGWEDKETRAKRKREEGLRRRRALRQEDANAPAHDEATYEAGLEGIDAVQH